MAYVYKITNKKNGKMYIGKTVFSIEKRWREHCSDYKRRKNENRPLYSAMRKYGAKSFKIEILEEVSERDVDEREKFWIELLGTFKNGYNATTGGDGGLHIDYDLVVSLYKKYKVQKIVAQIMGISVDAVSYILDIKSIKKYSRQELIKKGIIERNPAINKKKPVLQLTKDGEPLKVFPSLIDAGRHLGNPDKNKHISEVCRGKRKTAYGYKWEFA